MIGLLSLIAFRIGIQTSAEVGQTMTFAVLAFTQLAHVFNVRSERHSAFRNMFTNKLLLGAMAIVTLLMLAVLEIPALHDIFRLAELNQTQWIWVVCLSVAPLVIMETFIGVMRLIKPLN